MVLGEPGEFGRAVGLAEVGQCFGRREPDPRRGALQPDAQAPRAARAQGLEFHRGRSVVLGVEQFLFELLPVRAVGGVGRIGTCRATSRKR